MALVALPVTNLFYDPVKQSIVTPPDPWLNQKAKLIGYKGSSFMEVGWAYAPYIPFNHEI